MQLDGDTEGGGTGSGCRGCSRMGTWVPWPEGTPTPSPNISPTGQPPLPWGQALPMHPAVPPLCPLVLGTLECPHTGCRGGGGGWGWQGAAQLHPAAPQGGLAAGLRTDARRGRSCPRCPQPRHRSHRCLEPCRPRRPETRRPSAAPQGTGAHAGAQLTQLRDRSGARHPRLPARYPERSRQPRAPALSTRGHEGPLPAGASSGAGGSRGRTGADAHPQGLPLPVTFPGAGESRGETKLLLVQVGKLRQGHAGP